MPVARSRRGGHVGDAVQAFEIIFNSGDFFGGFPDVNIFPVLNDKEEFLGILLLDDIRGIMFDREMYDKVFVEELMHSAPDIIFFDLDNMETIMKKFKQTGAWNLPVVKEGKYFGFISKSKLLTAYRRKLLQVTP